MRRFFLSVILISTCLSGLASAQQASVPEGESKPSKTPRFHIDPIADSVFLGGTFVVAASSEALVGTGEIEGQLPDDEAELIGIDQWIADRDSASLGGAQASDLGAAVTMAWGVTDITLAALGKREDSGITYATLYLESAFTTWFMANLWKMAVRRPRPRAYIELRETGSVSPETQESLSFYSLHTAMAATLASTATYLAFTREGPAWEKWVIFGGGLVATSVTGVGRILSGAHFTTDVVAGFGAGVMVGTLVPHVHRVSPVDIAANVDAFGGTLGVKGVW